MSDSDVELLRELIVQELNFLIEYKIKTMIEKQIYYNSVVEREG